MAGSARWVRACVHGRRCKACGEHFTEYATKELRFELLPRPDGVGYAAVKCTAVVPCPGCGHECRFTAEGVSQADMKQAIRWLVRRTRLVINPFDKQPIVFPETMDDEGPCPCKPEDDAAQDDGASDDDGAEEEDPDHGHVATRPPPTPASWSAIDPPAPGRQRGRRLTSPSVRTCCPPWPITDATVAAAKRVLRCYSDRRTAPSFMRFMARFGIQVDRHGNPLNPDRDDR